MTTLQVRNNGRFGFDVTTLSGVGLGSEETTTTRTRVSDAQALADAIRQALATARQAGGTEFRPSDSSLLSLPAGLSAGNRDLLFDTVIGRAYAGGPLSAQVWSQAVDALEQWAGAQASMLPPETGGGSHLVRGTWYVNGLSWSLSELFTVNRVNTLAEIDRMVSDSLNVIAANNEAAKALTSLMKELFSQFYAMGPNAQKSRAQIEQAGLTDAAHPISYNQLLAYADKYIGSTSMIRRATSLSGTTYSPWSSGTNYAMNDLVSYNGKRWQSTALNTTSAADYNNSTGYNKWDTASYNGDLWQVIKEPFFGKLNGVTPGSSADDGNWTRVADYSATKEYTKSGEVVRVGDNYYKKLKDKNTTGVDPSDTANWEFHEKRVSRGATPGGAGWLELPENGLTRDDFRSLINEVETIIGAFGADNQVAQLRNETLFNSRSNVLEGLSTFLKGQQSTRSELARNA